MQAIELARDMFLAVEGGRMVGYADVTAAGAEREVVNVDLRVPAGRERGLFRSIGRPRAALGVDSENATGAIALYQGVGMHATSRSDTWERVL